VRHSCSQICLQQLELWEAAFVVCHAHGKSQKYKKNRWNGIRRNEIRRNATQPPVCIVFTQIHRNFWTSQVVWSRLKSTCRCQVKSNRVGWAQVDRRRLGVVLASIRVKFLYLSDSQVYPQTQFPILNVHRHYNSVSTTVLHCDRICDRIFAYNQHPYQSVCLSVSYPSGAFCVARSQTPTSKWHRSFTASRRLTLRK